MGNSGHVMPSVAVELGIAAKFPNLTMLDFTSSFSWCGCTYRGAGPSYKHHIQIFYIFATS